MLRLNFFLKVNPEIAPVSPEGPTVLYASPTQIKIQVPLENVVGKVTVIGAPGRTTAGRTIGS